MIVNELLTYACFHLNNSTLDNIKKVMLDFYSHDEIIESKKLLWNISGIKLGSYIDRKTTEKRSCDDANLSDIFDALIELDLDDEIPEFVAKDLKKIPERNPEELNLTSILERISKLEKSARSSDVLLTTHADFISQIDLFDISEKFSRLENKIQEHGVALTDLTIKNKYENNNNESFNEVVNECNIIEVDNIGNDSDWISIEGQPVDQYKTSVNKFRYRRRKRKSTQKIQEKKNNTKPVFANNIENNYELKGAPNYSALYLGRVLEGSKDLINKYMHSRNIDVQDVSIVSRPNSRFKSFKLIVSRDHTNILLDKYFWPKGVIVKPWRNFSVPHKSKEYFNSFYRSKNFTEI